MTFRNLEEQFQQTVNELYSNTKFPSKEPSALHPIIITRPNDPGITYGQGDNRSTPIKRTLTDLERMTKFTTSMTGLKFLLNQEILQLSNPISETRFIDPSFIIKNVAPYAHFKRQLMDQTDVIVNDPDRSPASTPLIGIAGRLQKQTAADATSRIMGKDGQSSLVDVLGSTLLGRTVSSIFQSLDGTVGINQRPELDVQGRYYSSILYEGRHPMMSIGYNALVDAFSILGMGLGIVGIPNIFQNNLTVIPLPSTRGYDDITPYFNPSLPASQTHQSYLIKVRADKKAGLNIPSITSEVIDKIVGLGLVTALKNFAGLGGVINKIRKYSSLSEFQQAVSIGPVEPVPPNVLAKIERSMMNRYVNKNNDTITAQARQGIEITKKNLSEQLKQLINNKPSWNKALIKRGIVGGITLENANQLTHVNSYEESKEFYKSLYKVNERPGYYHDLLNMTDAIEGIPGQAPVQMSIKDQQIEDYIKVHFLDLTNNRLIPFRAMIEGLSETITPEFSSNRYVGRIERNIVYTGVTRSLSFSLYVNAFSPDELEFVWKKLNYLTGLTYPSKFTSDGFMGPPIIQLTIGDLYRNQPGYIESITNDIEDGTSWEITPGSQVPQRVRIGITFQVIEKEAMTASSKFYGYLEPRSDAPLVTNTNISDKAAFANSLIDTGTKAR